MSHFVRCILEVLRQMSAKPLNYAKLANIEQEEKEAPGKLLDRLREALFRFTEIDPKSEEERVILKDRFLTQSAPDIRHQIRSDQISHSVVSDSLQPHESQHARPPCPLPTPGVHSDSCPSSQ